MKRNQTLILAIGGGVLLIALAAVAIALLLAFQRPKSPPAEAKLLEGPLPTDNWYVCRDPGYGSHSRGQRTPFTLPPVPRRRLGNPGILPPAALACSGTQRSLHPSGWEHLLVWGGAAEPARVSPAPNPAANANHPADTIPHPHRDTHAAPPNGFRNSPSNTCWSDCHLHGGDGHRSAAGSSKRTTATRGERPTPIAGWVGLRGLARPG